MVVQPETVAMYINVRCVTNWVMARLIVTGDATKESRVNTMRSRINITRRRDRRIRVLDERGLIIQNVAFEY